MSGQGTGSDCLDCVVSAVQEVTCHSHLGSWLRAGTETFTSQRGNCGLGWDGIYVGFTTGNRVRLELGLEPPGRHSRTQDPQKRGSSPDGTDKTFLEARRVSRADPAGRSAGSHSGLHETCMLQPAVPERQEITSWSRGPSCCAPPPCPCCLGSEGVSLPGCGGVSLLHPLSWEPNPHPVPHSYRKYLQGFLPVSGSSQSRGHTGEQLVPRRVAMP